MKYQNNKKHPVAFLIAALLACQPITAQAVTFADINQAPWPGAEVSINKAADLGLVVGETKNGKSYFKPKDPVSLAESCQFAYKVMVQTGKASANAAVTEKWTTVMNTYKIQSWAHTAVAYCLENSIISISDLSGFVSGEVNRSATREQAAEILGRALEVGVPSLRATATATKFVDNASISADARPYIALLISQKIVNGDDLNKFNPKNTLNRTETAVMVTNLYSVLKNTASTPVVSQPTSQSGKVASITNFYVNLENSSSYYLFSSSGITVTLNDDSSSVSELVNLFKNEGAIEAKLTLDGSSRVTKIEATSGDVEEEK
ncbi:MAG: S-layer homology domain-containing protein, partial [Anaerotignum sp.]|nr:S-layer homology domain-containing protein [Anaerotignum sp.]